MRHAILAPGRSSIDPAPASPLGFSARVAGFWRQHRTLFWTLHSAWALATGVFVIWLAREHYGFVPWVVLFLGLTWLSTLYFGRRASTAQRDFDLAGVTPAAPGMAEGAASYVTRMMYQETLFFLLPFYAYSTVLGEPSMAFLALLGVLAVLSCIDLLFDRWLRSNLIVRLVFFALVTFAAVNLLIPVLLPVDPTAGTRIAAGIALLAAMPLGLQGARPSRQGKALLGGAAAAFLAVTLAFPQFVPPVPLRLQSATFASRIERETLALGAALGDAAPARKLPDGLFALFEVFAPTTVPTQVTLRWELDGAVLREGRPIDITAHELGFRIWDAWRPQADAIAPGRYRVVMETRGRRVFGEAMFRVEP